MQYIAILIIILILIFILFFIKKPKKLDKIKQKLFNDKINSTINNKNISNKEKIIEIDKIYHKILLELNYNGSFGDILKKEPKIIKNLNKVWELHKLRNKLSHDFDIIDEVILQKKLNEYKKEIDLLLKDIN